MYTNRAGSRFLGPVPRPSQSRPSSHRLLQLQAKGSAAHFQSRGLGLSVEGSGRHSFRASEEHQLQVLDMSMAAFPSQENGYNTTAKERSSNTSADGQLNGHQSPASLALDTIGIPAFSVDPEGTVTQWNQAMAELVNVPSEAMVESRFAFDWPGDNTVWEASFKECLEGRNSSCRVCLSRLAKALGSFVREKHRIRMTPRRINGRPMEVLCFVEVFDEIMYDKEDSSGHNFMTSASSLLQDTNVSVCCIDLNLNVSFWNRHLATTSCYSEDEVLGRPFLRLIQNVLARQSLDNVLRLAISTERATENFELEFPTKSGETLSLLLNVAPIKEGPVCLGAILVALAAHVTENKRVDPSNGCDLRESHLTNEVSLEDDGSSWGERDGRDNGIHAQSSLDVADSTERRFTLTEVIAQLPSLIFGVNCAGCINEWNKHAADVFGFSAGEVFNRPLLDLVSPTSREAFVSVLNKVLEGHGSANFELEIRTKYKDTRYLVINAESRRDSDDAIVGMICVGQDNTEVCEHDKTLTAMARELRQFIDFANAAIFGVDSDSEVNEWNDKTAEITGYTKEEVFDCNLVDNFILPHMQESVRNVLDNALQGKGTSNFQLEFRTKLGEIRHLLVNVTTRRDADNAVVGVVCVAQDVTEAVQRDRAIAGMALELRQLIDFANAPIMGIDIDGNVNEWNRCTQKITGYSKDEAFDEPLVERFIAPQMQETVREILDKALSGCETSNYELEFLSKSGESRFMVVNATTRRDPDNNVVGVVSVGQDVTEDRRHAAELQRMQVLQAKQEAKVEVERSMSSYYAHELRNPLSAIDSALNALPDNLPPSSTVLINGMRLCSSFMSTIMNNLLDVRKMEEGKMILNASPLCLESLVDGVYNMQSPSVASGVQFRRVYNLDGKNWVMGDEHRIQQILTNVVTNAIKYTRVGSITLELRWEDDSVKFLCIDTGPGIPKQVQEKLFQRYVQRGGAPGTGLGLAIAKHLVDLYHGSIYFESDPSVCAGTTCIVCLPLPLCAAPEFTEVEEVALIEEPLRFLLVDDVKMNRMMLQRRIEKGIAPNSSIVEACTGEEALEICDKNEFDVIVVDQYMEKAGGVMLGTDVVYAMRRMRIRAIIIGCSGNDLEQEFRDAGADFVWQKPMPSNSEIIAHIRLALASKIK